MNTPAGVDAIIADAQILIIEGLKSLIREWHASGPVSLRAVCSKGELMNSLMEAIPSVLILDHNLLDFDSFDDLKNIRLNYPQMPVIILSNNFSRNDIVELNSYGIRNILHKTAEKEEIFDCLDSAMKGRKYYSGTVLDLLTEPVEKKHLMMGQSQLTGSEIEIVKLISQGLTNKEIAQKKYLSIHTIMTHRKNILRKLGASNASELLMLAIKSGIIDNIEYHI